MFRKLLFFFLFCSPIISNAQNDIASGNTKNAKDNFSLGNFKGALEEYLILLKADSNNTTYNFRTGVCYLNTNIDKSKALPYLLKASSDPKVDNKVYYELGRANMLTYKFDEAIKFFKKYKEVTNGSESFIISTDRQIEMCKQAQENIAKPINVTIENIGSEINSSYQDFKPFVPKDESYIVFSSKRAGNTGNMTDYDGDLTSDVYMSFPKYDKWAKVKNAGAFINTDLVEETCGISADGSKIFLYCDNYSGYSDILVSDKKGKSFTKAISVGKNINTNKVENAAAITPDKKYLFISSDRNAANAGLDLFMSRKLPSGEWSVPVNLGPDINTVYDEDYPYMAPDGKTLYFCSQGHNSMGGFDIFKSEWNEKEETWSEPQNLGYPLNTPDDDLTICFSTTMRHAYISSLRENGYGDLDIYKIIFNDIEPPYTSIIGSVLNKDSSNIYTATIDTSAVGHSKAFGATEKLNNVDSLNIKKNTESLNVFINITNNETHKKYGIYHPNKKTGNYAIVLPPGNYTAEIEVEGYQKYSEIIKIYEKSANSELLKDFVLTPR